VILRGHLWAAALLLSCLSSAAHADVPVELQGRPIVEIRVAGEAAGVTPEREIGIPLGAPLSRQLVRSAILRLGASGRWSDVQIDAVPVEGGVRLVAHLRPQVILTRVEYQGNGVIGDDDLARATGVTMGTELDDDTSPALVRQIREMYAERGYERAAVHPVLRDTDDPSRKVLLVEIDEGPPTRIVRISYEGRAPPAASGARASLSIDVGDILDRNRVLEAVTAAEARMRERGWLEARLGPPIMARVPRGVAVTIPSEPGRRYDVVVRGFEPLERSDVEDVLELGQDAMGPSVISGVRERVVDLYRRHGFYDAAATVASAPGERPNEARLLVLVEPGPQLNVVALSFPGARHFERDFLRDQVFSYLEEDLPGSSILHPVDTEVADAIGFGGGQRFRREVPRPVVVEPRRTFYEPIYAEAVDHIRELYQSAGFLSTQVGPARLVRLPQQRAVVEIPVTEGPRSMLHQVELDGNRDLTGREILIASELLRGEPFSHMGLEQARLRIVDLYHDRGYLYARVEPSVRFSDDRTRAEVTFRIVERFQVRVGQVIVRGATRTSESLIRSQLRMASGDLYRPALARESQERLLDLGVFRGVNVSPQDADLPAQVKPLLVTVTERPGQFLDFAAGFSTGEGVRGGFEYGYRNLFGYAVGLSLRVQLAFQFIFVESEIERRFEALALADRLERTVTAGLTMPHVPALPNTHLSLALFHLRDNERDFGLDKNGVGLTLTWRPTRRLILSQSGNLENNNVELFVSADLNQYLEDNTDPRLERLLRVPEGESTIVAFPLTVSFDNRDNAFVPTRGFFASASAEYARTLRTSSAIETTTSTDFVSDFVKVGVTSSAYFTLIDGLLFAAQVRIGRIFHLVDESKTYPNRSFYLGGVDTMRGYLQDALIPQDIADQIRRDPTVSSVAVRGGDAFVLVRGELRFPIVGWLHGGVFADIGNLWADPALLDPFDLRPTAGFGLRIATPVGPLALDYGFVLVRRDELREDVGAFHFSIGLF